LRRRRKKIVAIGGTGLIGSKLVEKLREDGHEPLPAAPDTGVNTITGEGLAEALEGAQVVVDVANAPLWEGLLHWSIAVHARAGWPLVPGSDGLGKLDERDPESACGGLVAADFVVAPA
jgi:hypothetical protein